MTAGVLGCALALALATVRADEEQDQIAVLQSATKASEKSAACQRLRLIGTAKCVPALASLLADETTSQAARHALEGLPLSEAGDALRAALATTSGKVRIQVGIIDSLGWRRESKSIELLVPFLSSTNLDLIVSVASALGRIDQDAFMHLTLLNGASDQARGVLGSTTFRATAQESLLRCIESLRDSGGNETTLAIYRSVFAKPASESLRIAAWRGLVRADSGKRTELLRAALNGTDRPLRLAALQLVRELADAAILAACLADWATLPADAQLALLDAQVRFGKDALPTVRNALASPHLDVRVAALEALADLGSPWAIPTLAKAAASGQPAEREAAREALTRVRGPGVRAALLAELGAAEVPERAELLRALGERGDREAANLLLRQAEATAAPVRLAALDALRRLTAPETMTPLLELATKSKSDDQLEPVFKALVAVCQASPDKSQTEGRVIESIRQSAPAQRRLLLPLLGELGTAEALSLAQAAVRDPDPELARQAVRVLTQWPNATPASSLLDLAESGADSTLHTLALRGAIEVSGQESDPAQRLALLERAVSLARRTDEKKQALAQIAQVPSPAALRMALKELANPDLVNEAGLAAVSIAEKLAATDSALADEAAAAVLAQCQATETVRRAWALRRSVAASGPFIRDWLVCGPYRQDGVEGATAVFDLAFGPEKAGEKVEWKPVPSGDHVDLSALFPGQANCVAYLRTQILAPNDAEALLLMGSDDGLKAWLNGQVVHRNNVDRGMVVDQDRAPIKLKQGANQLLLKVTQGGGGWAACARIVGASGQPIAGLRIEPAQP